MSDFNNFQDKGKYFEASSKLGQVSRGLGKVLHDEKLTDFEKGLFDWAGDLFGQLDWNSNHYKTNVPAGIFLLATDLRSLFFEKIGELNLSFDPQYSEDLYQLLKSRGQILPHLDRTQALQSLYENMSKDIFAGLRKGNI